MTKCPCDKMFVWRNVRVTKCPVTKCLCDEISVWRNVHVIKCPCDRMVVTKCPVTKCPVTKCPGVLGYPTLIRPFVRVVLHTVRKYRGSTLMWKSSWIRKHTLNKNLYEDFNIHFLYYYCSKSRKFELEIAVLFSSSVPQNILINLLEPTVPVFEPVLNNTRKNIVRLYKKRGNTEYIIGKKKRKIGKRIEKSVKKWTKKEELLKNYRSRKIEKSLVTVNHSLHKNFK